MRLSSGVDATKAWNAGVALDEQRKANGKCMTWRYGGRFCEGVLILHAHSEYGVRKDAWRSIPKPVR